MIRLRASIRLRLERVNNLQSNRGSVVYGADLNGKYDFSKDEYLYPVGFKANAANRFTLQHHIIITLKDADSELN